MNSKTLRRTYWDAMPVDEQRKYLELYNLEVTGYSEYGRDGIPRCIELRSPVPTDAVQYVSVRSLMMLLPSKIDYALTCVKSTLQPQRTGMFGHMPWQWHRDYR